MVSNQNDALNPGIGWMIGQVFLNASYGLNRL